MLGSVGHRGFRTVGRSTFTTLRTIPTFTALAAITVTRTAWTITVLRRRCRCCAFVFTIGVQNRRVTAFVPVFVGWCLAFHAIFGAGTTRTASTATATFGAFTTFTTRSLVAARLFGDQRCIGTDGTQCGSVEHCFRCW